MQGSLLERWPAVIADTYGTPPVALVRGRGALVWDEDGREYVDMLAGIAVNALGHAHPTIIEAVARQLGTLGHTSNLAATSPPVELAERLLHLSGRDGRVFFANSGAEANEAAFKLSRLTGRHVLVAADGAFHGRTAASLSLTGQPAKRAPFEPLVSEVRFVPFGDAEALRAATDESVAAVFLEPIQGEHGVVVPPSGYLTAAQDAARDAGALLILDEVQTGIGRTGAWFAHQREAGVEPDAMSLAKGLGGGIPIGAHVAFGDAASLWHPGMHGSTFGGNPVACAAALAVLDTITSDGLLQRATDLGARLSRGLEGLPGVAHVRGAGLLIGVVLDEGLDAREVERRARAAGVLLNGIATASGPHVVRLAPPLILTDDQADTVVSLLGAALEEVTA